MKRILVATKNPGKLREIRGFMDGLGVEILGLQEFPWVETPEEDGTTYLENALKKASAVARQTGMVTLADDSGLEVEALGGRPGVHSARFAGPGATDEENNRKLLELLKGVPPEGRKATFRCVLVLVGPSGELLETAEGQVEGIILDGPRGEMGFGYDPLFYVPELGRTLAELPLEVKNSISHRGRALRAMREKILKRLGSGRGAAG